jgi:hypothetical protein
MAALSCFLSAIGTPISFHRREVGQRVATSTRKSQKSQIRSAVTRTLSIPDSQASVGRSTDSPPTFLLRIRDICNSGQETHNHRRSLALRVECRSLSLRLLEMSTRFFGHDLWIARFIPCNCNYLCDITEAMLICDYPAGTPSVIPPSTERTWPVIH